METQAIKSIAASKLYVVATPAAAGQDVTAVVEKALRGGADVVQLRDKHSSAADILKAAKKLKRICQAHDALFIVNDRVDIALASGADGVHLGQEDLPLDEARKIVERYGRDNSFLIGRSTHSLEQALAAQNEGADYLGCGPVFATPTKPDYLAQGLELVRQYRERIRIPFVAIGGIDDSNISQVAAAGARCVAVVRAVMAHADPEAAARSLRSKIL
ncbi:MAG: thiamine-phosphate diphosphorylase [Elusimicrobia bacterium RIFCSPLOWO2_01_FULL_54_10]|nr:MAG: thiamine-phosphate diphosphorylase [Elusimicrobia bacterium RIFCSPLOWO2_01_FULL_54_10]